MAESEKKRLAGAATKTVEPKATVKPKAKPTPPIVEAIVKAGAVGAALFARHKMGGPVPKTDKPKKKVKTKGSGKQVISPDQYRAMLGRADKAKAAARKRRGAYKKKSTKEEVRAIKERMGTSKNTKGSGSRNTTKFARTGGSGGAAGAGLGRGSISPRKFKGGGLVGSPRRKKFI